MKNNNTYKNSKANLLSFDYVISLQPAKLLNKLGANICWWNSFIQLFVSTRDTIIINKFIGYVNEHKCCEFDSDYDKDKHNPQCWYCNVFRMLVEVSTVSSNLVEFDFTKYLFDIPKPIPDPKNKDNKIEHPFHIFTPNRQEDSFDGCNKWFEVLEKMIPDIYNLFGITTISEITCTRCNFFHNPRFVYEHAVSVPIDCNINSIQDAINLF
jgi:hypothetical protein